MASTFFGLEIGRRGIQTQQRALDVTGHNISNANTDGYTRQRALMQATDPYAYPGYNRPTGPGQLGTGVEVTEIERVRDAFIDTQVRHENSPAGEWNARMGTLAKLEAVLNEPSDTGLRSVLTQFWSDLQTLVNRSDDGSVRKVVRQSGIEVANTFNSLDQRLAAIQQDLNNSVGIKVDQVNNLADQVYKLNKQIVQVESLGDNANDLRDRRDVLIDELSTLAKINTSENSNGSVTVTIGGRILVNDQSANKIKTVNAGPYNYSSVVWDNDDTAVNLSSGEIQGMIYSRDVITEDKRAEINNMALRFMTLFNGQHQLGYGLDSNTDVPNYIPGSTGVNAKLTAWGAPATFDFSVPQSLIVMVDNGDPQIITLNNDYTDSVDPTDPTALLAAINSQLTGAVADVDSATGQLYFTSGLTGASSSVIVTGEAAGVLGFGRIFFNGTGSGDMRVDSNIDDVNHIAAASEAPTGSPLTVAQGDNGNALKLVALQHDYTTMGKYTFDDYYRGITAQLGVESQAAQRMYENQSIVLEQLEVQKQQVSGVSLDEEMTNMIKFQHAYNSAARVITAVDEILETIISRMGLVGR